MDFQYRGHTITIHDKIVEYFTSFIEPTVTERLFDMYLEGACENGEIDIEDIDLSQFSDEELSCKISSCMFGECQVYQKIKGYWDEELNIIEEEERMMRDAGLQEGDE